MESLPTELQTHIGHMLSRRRRDLCALALVSAHFKDIALPLLYQRLTLAPKTHLASTMSLLESSNLSKSVQELTLRHLQSPFDYSIIFKMTSLRSLSVIFCGLVFHSSVDQTSFVERVAQSCQILRQIHLNLDATPRGSSFPVPRIQNVYWESLDGFDSPFLSLCQASASTLTHISFPAILHTNRSLLTFTQIDFPHLVSLNLGTCDLDGDDTETSHSMLEFLVRHSGIEHLRLGYLIEGNVDSTLDLAEFLVDPNILPNLKSLGARPYTIVAFLKIRAKFWATLSSLSISHGLDVPGGFQAMIRQLDMCKRLDSIRNLELYIQSTPQYDDRQSFVDRMESIASLLLRLESICCVIPNDLKYDNFTQIFSKFTHIKLLDFLGWPTEPFEEIHRGEMAWDLAELCMRLEVVRFRTTVGQVDQEITLNRDPENGEVTIGKWLKRADLDDDQ